MLSREKTFKWKVTVLSFYFVILLDQQYCTSIYPIRASEVGVFFLVNFFVFFFQFFLRHDFLKQQNFKLINLVAGHKEHSHSFLCVVLVFCTRPMRSTQCSDQGVGFIFKTKSQNVRKSYDFSTYNKWDTLLIIHIFFPAPKGLRKKKTVTCKMSALITSKQLNKVCVLCSAIGPEGFLFD